MHFSQFYDEKMRGSILATCRNSAAACVTNLPDLETTGLEPAEGVTLLKEHPWQCSS
jgi:hypothetical protein